MDAPILRVVCQFWIRYVCFHFRFGA